MTGIIIITHGQIGKILIDAAEYLQGTRLEAVTSISIDSREDSEKLLKTIAETIKVIEQDNGVLILTDMFGGTPSNLSYSFLKEGNIEVLSGVNLPILLKAVSIRKNMDLIRNVKSLEEFGKKSILCAQKGMTGLDEI